MLFRKNLRSKLAIILVAFDEKRTQSAMDYLERFPASVRVVIINNKELVRSPIFNRTASFWKQLEGSNSAAEFSGWQEGLNYLDAKDKYQEYLFVNDTVVSHRKYTWLRHFALRHQVKKKKPCVGFVNSSKIDFTFGGAVFKEWISTYIFCMRNDALNTLNRRLDYSEELKRYITEELNEDNFFSSDLCPNLKSHLLKWLFGGGWYASQKLRKENQVMFQKKALAILNEKYISALLVQEEIKMTDPLCDVGGFNFFDSILSRNKVFLLPESRFQFR